jgi:hypothetical protein
VTVTFYLPLLRSHFALWLDADFLNGSSNSCETYGNPAPLSSTEDFSVSVVEVWGFTEKR